MIVFKNYFKIVKKHIGIIIMFSAISIGIAIANTSYNVQDSYMNINPTVAIINHDKSSLTTNFTEYIEKNAKIVEVNDSEKDIQDTLYANKANAILIIPNNYTEEFLKGNEPEIEIKKSAQNFSETVEVLVNKYFKIANIYSKIGMSENEIVNKITNDLEKEINVKVQSEQSGSKYSKLAIFYSFENYAFISIFIFIIGTIMCIFNKETISKRNAISKMEPKEFSKQLFMGHICLTLLIWLIFAIISIILYKDLMFDMKGLLLIVNSLIFAITITSLAYLIGTLIKKQNVISGIQNILSLGLSFISGCFISVDLLDKNIVNIAKAFPAYWFIDGNYEIVKLSKYNFETLKPIIINWIIVILFGMGYFIISRMIIKNRTKQN